MKHTSLKNIRHHSRLTLLRVTCLLPLLARVALAQEPAYAESFNAEHSVIIGKVQEATRQFKDLNVALREGWVAATPCVSGPDTGAMGVHFLLPPLPGRPDRLHDGAVNVREPEFLIYEPMQSGAMRFVGVEFVVIAGEWAAHHPEGGTPSLEGNLMNFIDAPNRYGLPAFYELHVWAWEHNPQGTFADWNTHVSCDNEGAE